MSQALHARIRNDIAKQIRSGAWPPGHKVPSEHELMAQYDCARMTVNKALAPLAELGLIVRRRKAGSFVARPRIHSAVLDIPDIAVEIARRGEPYRYKLLGRSQRRARPNEAEALGLKARTSILVLTCLHSASGRPFALEERLIDLLAVPEAADIDFDDIPPGGWLLGHVPWTEAEHRITAANPTPAVARRLAVTAASACLVLERRTWRGDDRITHVRLTFPGEVYDLVARFSPGGPPTVP